MKGKNRILVGAVFLVLLVIVVVAGMYISVFSTNILSEQDKWGQFGDYFGGVLNPILSFFAFVALLVTLRVQLTANEDSGRRHDEQLREQRLFQLVQMVGENALNTKLLIVGYSGPGSPPDEYAHGHQAQHHATMRLRGALAQRVRIGVQNGTDMEVFEFAQEKFSEWRKDHWPSIGLFVESVFLVLKFILKESSSKDFSNFSLGVLRVQLSESERLLLWYSSMFTAEYAVYLKDLLDSGFVDDHEGSLDDQIKPWRAAMMESSLVWSEAEIKKRLLRESS